MVKITFVLFLSFALICYAQPSEKIIRFDFGKVSSKAILSHEFIFKEKIVSVMSMCECLQINMFEDKGSYIARVEINPQGYRGKVSLEAVLMKEDNSLVRLKISAFVEDDH